MASLFRYWFCLIVIFCLCRKAEAQESYYDERSGVEVFFPSSINIFPRIWSGKNVSPDISPVPSEEVIRLQDLLTHAFLKYPVDLLTSNLDRVYVMKSMKFYGLPYGGTNYKQTIYLCDDTDNPYFSNEYIEQVFHHEFSSILIRNFSVRFDKTKWLALNPPSFRYGKGGAEAISQGTASMVLDPEMMKQGFLSEYSTASLEEDINVFAQNLFTGSRDFWSAVGLNDIIREKTLLLISFYHKVNPVFTETYFRSFYYNSTAQR